MGPHIEERVGLWHWNTERSGIRTFNTIEDHPKELTGVMPARAGVACQE
jgi:hypothetical protein